MSSRPAFWCSLVLTLFVGSSCVPSEGSQDFSEESRMFEIQQEGTLVIGIANDAPPFGFVDPKSKEPQGFTVELGKLVAEELGVEPQFVADNSDRLPELAGQGTVDVAFPLMPATRQLLQEEAPDVGFNVTDPFYVAHQRLLVPSRTGIDGVRDLGGKRVCSLINPATEVDLDMLNPEVELVSAGRARECAAAIKKGGVDAVTASDALLIEMLATIRNSGGAVEFEITGDDLTTEGYGALTETGDMAEFVGRVLNEAVEEGDWATACKRWIAPYTEDEKPQPPEISLEDAAALFPS